MKNSRRTFLKTCATGAASLAFAGRKPAAAAECPNIVLIMMDDLGYSDLGCYGGDAHTPNIDGIAKDGLRFTQFYNMARCCPTRAALMTGLYPHQVGLIVNGRSLSHDGVTITEALGEAGYQTAMTGKWHLSETLSIKDNARHMQWLDHQIEFDRDFGPLESYPINRGFQRHYGIIWGVIDYFDPFSLAIGEEPVKEVPDDYYITDAITEYSVKFIRDMAQHDAPFFIYVAHCASHWPIHAREEDIAKYAGMFEDGWHALRKRRYARQVDMGLIDPKTHPLPEVMGHEKDWDDLTPDEKAMEAKKMQVHAAMIDRADQGIGEIIAALKETGRYENTLILLLADNGASPEIPRQPGYDRPAQTREGVRLKYHDYTLEELGSEISYTGIGSWWANAANTPFRFWKMESFEGGIHTPLIAHWPEGLKTEAGAITDQAGHVVDVMPTCLEVAGAAYPKTYKGHDILPAEGRSLAPILRGETREGHKALYFEHVGGKAIMADGWKAVQATRGDVWELYHLAEDRTETNNLAEAQPERLNRMAGMWQDWARHVKLME